MKRFDLKPIAAVALSIGSTAYAQTQTLPDVVVTGSPIIESNNVDEFSGFTTRITESQVKDLGALDLVKQSKASLEQAVALDPKALEGSAYTSMGALYYQVPGWPIGFGDDEQAEKLLKQALQLNPNGIDPNYFYGDFLFRQKRYSEAKLALEKAQAATARPGREVADRGRQAEIAALLAKVQAELK